jgi:hypothetical protein
LKDREEEREERKKERRGRKKGEEERKERKKERSTYPRNLIIRWNLRRYVDGVDWCVKAPVMRMVSVV